jgi:hypothetical protein
MKSFQREHLREKLLMKNKGMLLTNHGYHANLSNISSAPLEKFQYGGNTEPSRRERDFRIKYAE